MQDYHQPVLFHEAIRWLDLSPGGIYIDATTGGGGHTQAILEMSGPDGVVYGIDRDSEALEYASRRLLAFKDRFRPVKGNFADIGELLMEIRGRVNGVLMDLGVSSHQLDTQRGFSFMRDEPLDMRMDNQSNGITAADVVNRYSQEDLARIFREYGEERHSNRLARAIVSAREKEQITTTGQLSAIIRSDIGRFYKGQQIDPATRTFQALRIEVNGELDAVRRAIPAAADLLAPNGRLVIISFHSLEDRIVKETFRDLTGICKCPPKIPVCICGAKQVLKVLTSKPVVPSDEEIAANPRSRSSKLRCALKV